VISAKLEADGYVDLKKARILRHEDIDLPPKDAFAAVAHVKVINRPF